MVCKIRVKNSSVNTYHPWVAFFALEAFIIHLFLVLGSFCIATVTR